MHVLFRRALVNNIHETFVRRHGSISKLPSEFAKLEGRWVNNPPH